MLSETSRAAQDAAHTGFFEKRQLQRYAGIWSPWALGVGDRERLFRAPRTPSPDAEPRGSLRLATKPGSRVRAGEVLSIISRSKADQNASEQPVGRLRLQAVQIVDDRQADGDESGPAI